MAEKRNPGAHVLSAAGAENAFQAIAAGNSNVSPESQCSNALAHHLVRVAAFFDPAILVALGLTGMRIRGALA